MTVDKDALKRPFEQDVVQWREGAYGKQLAYIDWSTVARRLNDACEDEWDFRITNAMLIGEDLLVFGELTIPGLGTRGNMGVQRMRPGSGEDLYKGAASDCLKKCATLFGVALELYGPDREAGETSARASTPTNGQPQQRGSVVTRPGDAPSPRQIAYLEKLLEERSLQGHNVAAHLSRVEDTKDNRGNKLDRITASNWINSLTEDRVIPPHGLADQVPVSGEPDPKAEGAESVPTDLRARLLTRSGDERTIWRNTVRTIKRDRATWRHLVRLARQLAMESSDPSADTWRFELLVEFAPPSGEVIDGIATVAAECGIDSHDLDAMILERFASL